MAIILQGSLAHFPLGEVLPLLAFHRHTGTLDAVAAPSRARIFLQNGEVVHAEGSAGTTAEEIVAGLFLWDAATFTFLDELVLPEGVQPRAIDLNAAIAEGTRRVEERVRLLQLYPSEDIVLRVVDDPKVEGKINLTADELKILLKIGKSRVLAELRADLQRSAAALYPVVHHLETSGLLRRVSKEEAAAAGAKDHKPQIAVAPAPVAREAATKITPIPVAGSLTLSTGGMFPLVDELYTIGRTPENTIMIEDGSVSSKHARVSRTTDGFMIEDVQSRNGTFVNGDRVTTPRPLADGDEIRVGKVILTFNLATPQRAPMGTARGI